MSVLAIIFAAAVAQGPMPRCLPHDQAGMIIDVKGATPAGKNAPYISRQTHSGLPTDSQLLCPGDVVANPEGSGVTIRYKLSGQATMTLASGGANLTVVAGGLQAQLAMLSERTRNLFDYMAFRASGVRGGDDPKDLFPLPAQISAVPTWGPLVVAWDGDTAGRATVRSGAAVREITGRGRLAIDLTSDCDSDCSLMLSVPSAGIKSEAKIVTMSAQDALAQLNIKQLEGDVPPTVIAAWLGAVPQVGAWQLQQASLLWNAACDYPAFGGLVTMAYGLHTEPDTCAAARLASAEGKR